MTQAIITGNTTKTALTHRTVVEKAATVYGTYRRTASANFWRIEELGIAKHPNLHLVEYDLNRICRPALPLQTIGATEVYNLAAQSFRCRSISR